MADGGCTPHHDWFNALLTMGLCVGIIISYAPQHYRIISAKSSEGLSPVFLLLGSTSSAAGMWNMITLQWGIAKCCRVVSWGSCAEMTAGIVQLSIQWFGFTLVFILYMKYYPDHLKYIESSASSPLLQPKRPIKSAEWRLSQVLAWVTFGHLVFIAATTIFFLSSAAPSPTPNVPLPSQIVQWARFLGVTSAILAGIQYAPQLIHTYRHKVVGALSIPMMCIQTPGSILMITSIALRPGTNWTSWITFLVAMIMQGSLLVMCIIWKIRQERLGIDDFGDPVNRSDEHSENTPLLA